MARLSAELQVVHLTGLVSDYRATLVDALNELDDIKKTGVITFQSPEIEALYQRRLDRLINDSNRLDARMEDLIKQARAGVRSGD